MTIWKANLNKEWLLHRQLLIDYAFLAVGLAALLPLDNYRGFGIVGFLLAASLGARIGGDEAMNETWEFVLTRPVTRMSWLRMRFLLGLIPLGLLAVAFLLFDAVELNSLFGRLVADPIGAGNASGVAPLMYLPPLAGVLMIYTLSFAFALRERRPENVMNHRAGGLVFGVVVMVAVMAACQFVGRSLSGDWSQQPGPELAAFVLVTLTASGLIFLGTQRSFNRREFAGAGGEVVLARSSSWAGALLVIVIVLLVLGVLTLVFSYQSARNLPVATPVEGK